ncbi:hypothetical protein [Coprococcus sp. AF21-14LB]|uniref:hypothetical protein n=1 Tax=Coprococcus sp. AF21-14LB TaxID=2292231 RepID=UPI000E485226|nr:hypothetical protein [Coprococcus sp. AF21-14LB]RGS78060.1 hypothetical protein DWX73_09525 [Coprococcus sp. AF21-14LB]
MRDVQNKKNIYRICFISFIIINIGLIWFYIKSEAQYQPGIHGIESLIPYLWFSMAMLGAVVIFYYHLKFQKTRCWTEEGC